MQFLSIDYRASASLMKSGEWRSSTHTGCPRSPGNGAHRWWRVGGLADIRRALALTMRRYRRTCTRFDMVCADFRADYCRSECITDRYMGCSGGSRSSTRTERPRSSELERTACGGGAEEIRRGRSAIVSAIILRRKMRRLGASVI